MVLTTHSRPTTHEGMTGDAVICCSNTSTGLGLRTLTSSMWNHAGIVVRINKDGSISGDHTGELHVLEINTWAREDAVTGEMVLGAGYSRFDWMSERYNIVAIRPMKSIHRTRRFLSMIPDFVDKHRGVKFTTNAKPFVSAFIGIPLDSDEIKNLESMFCSEFMAHFYTTCTGISLDEIFGEEGPELPELVIPEDFSYTGSPNSGLFEPRNVTIYVDHSDIGSVILPIVLFTFIVMCFIWSLLPR